jgi:hypothetical protein
MVVVAYERADLKSGLAGRRQREFCRSHGIDQGYLSRLLSGEYEPQKITPRVHTLCINLGLLEEEYITGVLPRNSDLLTKEAARICRGDPRREQTLIRLLTELADLS